MMLFTQHRKRRMTQPPSPRRIAPAIALLNRLRGRRGLDQPGRKPIPDERHQTLPDGHLPLHIASWNIHSSVGIDARFAPDRIAQVIRGLGVDAIGLQEVGWHHRGEMGLDQFAYLAEQTGMRALAAPTKHHRSAHYGNALLTRLPVKGVDPIDLSQPMREPRGALAARLELAPGVEVRVMVAHFGLDPWERNAQVGRILAYLDRVPPLPTLFMGDLNEWLPSARCLRRLSARLPDCAAPRSFHAKLPTLRLDRIFVSSDLRLAGYGVVRTRQTRLASDHLPVRALIGVPAAQATAKGHHGLESSTI
ncbi:Metal-dependent hydrolase, endonuclease/exonuclease/phosphatase family [Azospirillum sp. RU38E]|nr:Metal-dependent hydrolase, endonuclease/exonuclease/phosphatase family [Azospirillum sp. RU38E]SNT20600.1 Metal-dependent hydrolase, endonuclease/exonuclease/phosphatase family [Azospirillum sp. RU37A]